MSPALENGSLRTPCNEILPGQYYDNETGLNYNYYRDYDPAIGRYIQSDPIGLDGGLNTYVYAESRPTDVYDPDGLEGIGPWTFAPGPERDAYEAARRRSPGCAGQCFLGLFGIEGLVGGGLVASGQPTEGSKRFRTQGSSIGTSPAGRAADRVFGKSTFPSSTFPRGAPTISGGPGTGSAWRITRTRSVARFVGRWVPYAGWGLLAKDAADFASCLKKCSGDECKSGQ